ncbi:MAG: hypothetical protein AAGH15_18150 [Myxococcota bacterium]
MRFAPSALAARVLAATAFLVLFAAGRAEAQRVPAPPGWGAASTDPGREGVVLPIRSGIDEDVRLLQLDRVRRVTGGQVIGGVTMTSRRYRKLCRLPCMLEVPDHSFDGVVVLFPDNSFRTLRPPERLPAPGEALVLRRRSRMARRLVGALLFVGSFIGGLAVTVVGARENPTGEGRSRGNLVASSVLYGVAAGALGLWVTGRDSVYLE